MFQLLIKKRINIFNIKMGKAKNLNLKPEKNVPLERQILDSKVVKPKNRDKVKLRAKETGVSV